MAAGPTILWRVRNTFLDFATSEETCRRQELCAAPVGTLECHAWKRSRSADRVNGSLEWRILPAGWGGGAPKNSPRDETQQDRQCHTAAPQESASQAVCQKVLGVSLRTVLVQPRLPSSPAPTLMPLRSKSSSKVKRSRKNRVQNLTPESLRVGQHFIPKPLPVGELKAGPSSNHFGTTMIFQNIACRCSQQEVIKILDEAGFGGTYACIHVPMNRRGSANLGFFFVTFSIPEYAETCKDSFHGKVFGTRKTTKICEVSAAHQQTRGCQA